MTRTFLVLFVLFFAQGVSAQLLAIPSKPLSLSIVPAFPEPNARVQVRIDTTRDLTDADIAWYVDGVIDPDLGSNSVTTVVAPAFGEEMLVEAVVSSEKGVEEAALTIRPASVDVVWSTDTYTPPTYKGRSIPSSQSTIVIEAYPRVADEDGALLPRNSLTYTWKKNSAAISSASGKGRASISLPAPRLFSTDTISVEVSAPRRGVVAEQSVQVSSVDPFLRLYHDHPLFGILYHRELSTFNTIYDSEARVVSAPFYAHVESAAEPSLLYEWRVNGTTIETDPDAPHRLTLDAGGASGRGRVQLELSDERDYFLSTRGAWDIILSLERSSFINRPRFE